MDNPAALKEPLKEYFGDRYTTDEYEFLYNLLYTLYALPNVILPLVGGFLIDKIGVRKMLLVFGACIVVGQAIVAVGCSVQNFSTMLFGRFVFGLGGESLNVGQSTMMATWFKGKELAFALGLNLSIARLGSVVNDIASPVLARSHGVPGALWIGLALCIAAFLCSGLLIYVDSRAESTLKKRNSALRVNSIDPSTSEEVNLSVIRHFSKLFWLLTVVTVILYCSILPFNNIASSFLIEKWYHTMPKLDAESKAGAVMGIPFIISAVASPFLGVFIDRYGGRAILIWCAAVLVFFVHLMLIFLSPVLPLVCLGVSYSIFAAAVWPSIAYVVPAATMGTAYGLVTAVQNAGLTATPLIVAAIRTRSESYDSVLLFFMSLAAFGIVISVWLNIADARSGNVLNKTSEATQKRSQPPEEEVNPLLQEDPLKNEDSETDP
eukprot:GILJ01009232.1.p1 GENE.GILJ01009232.1~~GILJ01009232.1.p1  ORF type:complete len:436 (-),score=60.05 GILJ01009232.1:46-1353(-)